jgi:two-component sensor histidine kinase
VDVRTLIEREVFPFSAGDQVALDGQSIRVSPKVAMSLAVVLHELATNATKYGALSVPAGRVDISWSTLNEDPSSLRLRWRETGGPPVKPPAKKGFGTTLIERSLPHDLGGSVALRFLANGLEAELTFPLAHNFAAVEPFDEPGPAH